MKKTMSQLSCVLAALYLALPAMSWADRGSSGTTGGGDYQIQIEQFLPKRLVIKYRFQYHQSGPVSGTKLGWGVWPMEEHAHYLESDSTFELDKLQKSEDPISITYTRIGKSTRKPGEESDLNLEKYPRSLLDTSIEWEGMKLSRDEFEEGLSAIKNEALNAIDLEQPETMAPLILVDQFNQAVQRIWSGGDSVLKDLSVRFNQAVDQRISELRLLADQVIRPDQSCDSEKYSVLVARFQNWKMASSAYYDEVQAVLGTQPLDKQATLQKIYTFLGEVQYRFQGVCKGLIRMGNFQDLSDKDFQ